MSFRRLALRLSGGASGASLFATIAFAFGTLYFPYATMLYDELYGLYRELHDGFGGVLGAKADFPSLMKRLLALRERETAHREANT